MYCDKCNTEIRERGNVAKWYDISYIALLLTCECGQSKPGITVNTALVNVGNSDMILKCIQKWRDSGKL